MEEGSSFEIWGRYCLWKEDGGGGGEPLSLEDLFMGVNCGGVFGWVGKLLAKTSSLRLGWEIE